MSVLDYRNGVDMNRKYSTSDENYYKRIHWYHDSFL